MTFLVFFFVTFSSFLVSSGWEIIPSFLSLSLIIVSSSSVTSVMVTPVSLSSSLVDFLVRVSAEKGVTYQFCCFQKVLLKTELTPVMEDAEVLIINPVEIKYEEKRGQKLTITFFSRYLCFSM